MTITIDLDQLQAAAGIQIPLAQSVKVRKEAVEVEPVTGFAGGSATAIGSFAITATVHSFHGNDDAELAVTVEQSSDNGDTFSTVHEFTFTEIGSGFAASGSAPSDMLRVVLTPSGVFTRAAVSVVVAPTVVVQD